MWNQTLTLVLAFGFYTAGIAFAQTAAPNPTQQPSVTVADGQTPLFRITVVGRTTPAINYRPRSGDTKDRFHWYSLMPQARGRATVSGEQGYIQVDARFERLAAGVAVSVASI